MEKKQLPPGFQARELKSLDLPVPSAFRELRPAVLGIPPVSRKARLFERKRLLIGFGIAAAFHMTLGLAWWLTPPLRLKAAYAAERWVQILPLPEPPAPAPQAAKGNEVPSAPVAKPKPGHAPRRLRTSPPRDEQSGDRP